METNVNYTVVGAFVISLTACIVMVVIWLSAGLSINEYNTYEVYMTESVSGLTKDSTVEFNGVNVGKVSEIVISKDNPQLVKLILQIEKNTPITRGTFARLSTRGLTGITFIGLQDQGEDKTPLVADKGQKYPVIPTKPSLLLRLDTAVTKVTDSITQVSQSLHSLLDQENLRTFKEILISLEDFTDMLSKNRKQMSEILKNAAGVSQQINRQTLPTANKTVNTIDAISNNIDAITNDIKRNPSVLIRGSAPRALGPGEN